MQPRRPDSAKSRVTQKTLDTQLNQSKFSETFTSYTTFGAQKKDEFLKYLQQKQKDPKFKKYQQTTLPQIPQTKPKQQLSKINSKPFQKRPSKIGSKPKIQQEKPKQAPKQINQNKINQDSSSKWTFNQQNGTKKQNKQEMNSSKSFAEKNKQKMNSITAGLKKIQTQEKKAQKRIDLKGFKVNVPGKRDNKNNQEQKQAQNEFIIGEKPSPKKQMTKQEANEEKPAKQKQKTQEEIKRQQEMLEISRFINEVQMKNIDYYPEGYEEFVEKNESHTSQSLEKININDFLIEPTERDYEKIKRKIRQNQRRLLDQQNMTQSRLSNATSANPSTDQTSIDLDKIIDGDSQSELRQQEQHDNEVFLSSISSKDLKERNLFLTEVLKGRVTRQDISRLEEMDKSQIKMIKLDDNKEDDDDVEIMEINMMKKKSNRLFERNMIEAGGQIYRDCDYLSEENKQRLEKLLNGEMDPSPFELSEWERFAIRRIDEGIRLYRQFSNSLKNNMNQQVISQDCLPKDPNLRKQAQRKILKDKMDSINAKLQQIQNIAINQASIKQLIEQHRPARMPESTQNLINERNSQMNELQQKRKVAAQIIQKVQDQKAQMEKILKEMQKQFQKYETQCKEYEKLTVKQIVEQEKKQLREQKKQIEEISKALQQIQTGTEQTIEAFHRQMSEQIQILKEIQNLSQNQELTFNDNYQNLSIEDIDAAFEKKAKQDPQLNHLRQKIFKQQQKQNGQTI